MPLFIGSGALYYRTDLLERYGYEPPETWAEMAAQASGIAARKAEEGREISGFSGQFKPYEGLVCDLMEYRLRSVGGGQGLFAATVPGSPTINLLEGHLETDGGGVRFRGREVAVPLGPRPGLAPGQRSPSASGPRP